MTPSTPVTPRPPQGDWLGTPYLRFDRHDGLATVTIDRPEARNALTGAMYFGIRYAVGLVNRDPSLHGLLITGTGDIFAPGGDLGRNPVDWWTDFDLLAMDVTPFNAIRGSAKPVVCAVNGLAQGGGMMIAMLADVSVASDRATFRAPELLRGIADTYYGQILPRQVGAARARDIMITGRTLSAAEAVEWGVVSRAAPHDRLMDTALDALRACIRSAPEARREVKRVMDEFYGRVRATEMETSCYGPEAAEGFRAFKDRRAPDWVPATLRTDGRL
jgi:enoyl-CoA hydratase/carnithine racemase